MSDIPESDEAKITEALFGKRPAARANFYLHGARNEDASIAAGYPIYEDRVYVSIRIPDSKDFVSRPAKPVDYREHAEAYARFERVRDWKQHSIELLPGITTAQLATLRELGLFTIEQLAAHTPATAPWLTRPDGDPYPVLEGALTPQLLPLHAQATRLVAYLNKPRLRLVDGQLQEIA